MTSIEQVRTALTMLKEWHDDLPEHVGDKEPAALASALTALAELEKAATEPAGKVGDGFVTWSANKCPPIGSDLYTTPPPAKPAPDIYDAYKSWPEDIRKKLSLHDLRRMSGWRMQAEFNPLNHEQSR